MIFPLQLGTVNLPAGHPRAADATARLQGHVIDHPDGVIVVDTGCGTGNDLIDRLYAPRVIDLVDALTTVGIDERSVVAIVNTHLHFDHCGQNARLDRVPVWITQPELDTVETTEHYTVREWAAIDASRRRIAVDGEEIAEGVRLLATPGHTPGHQSLLVRLDDRDVVLCGDCAYFESTLAGGPLPGVGHDHDLQRDSIGRLRAMRDEGALVIPGHDPVTFRTLPETIGAPA